MNTNTTILLLTLSVLVAVPSQIAFADSQEKLDFAAGLEETLGHFWAIELNLDERNARLAVVHATHPIAELYDSMRPVLQATDPALDSRFQTTLLELRDKVTADVSREQAQRAVDDAKDLVEEVRSIVVGNALGNDPNFKLRLMKALLAISVVEYYEAVYDGSIVETAEFQDGSSFVWRSQQIFNEIKSDIGHDDAEEIDELYADLWTAYDDLADPSTVGALADGIVSRIDGITGDMGGSELLDYVETIRILLVDAKAEYRQGNTDLALSHVTKAYLDNYEFLEAPLIDAGERELMGEIELMMRKDLRSMIQSEAPVSQVDAQIDAILERMDTVAVIVPEFGAATAAILLVAITAIVVFGLRSRSGLVRVA